MRSKEIQSKQKTAQVALFVLLTFIVVIMVRDVEAWQAGDILIGILGMFVLGGLGYVLYLVARILKRLDRIQSKKRKSLRPKLYFGNGAKKLK